MSKRIAFYSCFFGSDSNWANLIPHVPSPLYDCYYFTNNPQTYNRATWSKWRYVFLPQIPIYNDDIMDAFCSKEIKACPHRYPLLDQYDYTVYFDSKNVVDAEKVVKLIDEMEEADYCMVMPKHGSDFHSVWDEYNLCINYPKYAAQKDIYRSYLDKYLRLGFDEHIDNHYTTQFIIRKNNSRSKEIGELWYKHIQECGIECQISFSIIQQLYKSFIHPIDYLSCYSYLEPY